jgi:hypothetical protein
MLRKIVFLLCATSAVLAIPRELSISVNFIISLYSRIVWRQVLLNVYTQAQSYFVIVRWEIQSAVRLHPQILYRVSNGNRCSRV